MVSDRLYNCWRECTMAACAGFLVFYAVLRALMFAGLQDWDAHQFSVMAMLIWTVPLVTWRLHVHQYLKPMVNKLSELTIED